MSEKVNTQQINQLLSRTDNGKLLLPREREFILSVALQLSSGKRKELSYSQAQWFSTIDMKYSADSLQEEKDWQDNYSDELIQNTTRMAQYYVSNPPYFSDYVLKLLDNNGKPTGHRLTRREYRKLCEGKYAKRVLAQYESEPRFSVGQTVQFRKAHRGVLRRLSNAPAVVLAAHYKPIVHARQGAIPYKVLPFGDAQPVEVTERDLKSYKANKR